MRKSTRLQRLMRLATVLAVAAVGGLFTASAHAAGRIGFVGAVNYGQVANVSAPETITYSVGGEQFTSSRTEPFAPGWEFGGVYEWPRAGRVRFETGARYLVQPGEMEIETESAFFQGDELTETHLEYASVPIQMLITPFKTHRMRLSAGVNVAYLLRATSKLSATMTDPAVATQELAFANIFESLPYGEWTETTSQYKRWNTELSAGAGWEFGGDRPALRFDLRYAYGLPDISEGEAEFRTQRISFSVATLY